MCYVCYQLSEAFGNSIKKAQELEDKAFESQLKEKRNWFLTEVYNKDCKVTKQLYSKLIDEEIDKDSTLLDGKRWDEILEKAFTDREPSAFPKTRYTQEPGKTFVDVLKELDEILDETNTQIPLNFDTIKTPEINLKPKYCSHKWTKYEGLGTKAPETICLNCGISKT